MAVGSLLVFLIVVVESFVVTYCLEEPSCGLCSRFEYDNKMLEKMVRIEHQQELLQQTNENQNIQMNELKDQLEHSQQSNEDQKKRMNELEDQLELSQQSNGNQIKRINELEAKLITINDTTLKAHVGFHATTVKNQSPKAGETLVFTKVKLNTDGRYDVNTGVFTAPVDGMYMFATQICNYGSRGLQFNMYVNDVWMTNTYQKDSSQYVCTSANMVADLKAGDHVFVQANQPSIAGQVIFENVHRECMFTGVLVS